MVTKVVTHIHLFNLSIFLFGLNEAIFEEVIVMFLLLKNTQLAESE